MRIIDESTVAFESNLETKYAQYLMEIISGNNLWESGEKAFVFRGRFSDYSKYLVAFCFLSIEQGKTVVISDGIPEFNGIPIDYVEITGFKAVVSLNTNINYKQKKLNKLAKYWANTYPFTLVEVQC